MSVRAYSMPLPRGKFADPAMRPLLAVAIGLSAAVVTAVLASATSPWLALVGAVGIACGAGILVSPSFGLVMLCFSLPFERIGRLTDDFDTLTISASRIIGLLTLATLVLHAAIKKEKLHFGLPLWLYAGFTLIGALSNAWMATPDDTLKDSLRVFANLLFFFYLINAIRDYKTARLTVVVWMLASFAAAGYSLSDYYVFRTAPLSDETQVGLTSQRGAGTVVNDGAETRSLGVRVARMFGTTSHPALFGLNNVMVIPFFLWAIRFQRGFLRVFWTAGLLAATTCVVLSNTRAVLLLAIFTIGYAVVRRLLLLTPQLVVAVVLLAAVAVPFIPEDVYRRTLDLSLYSSERGDAVRTRLKMLSKSVELLQENFVRGIGLNDQRTLVNMITDETTGLLTTDGLRASAHNEYVWILVEVGIFGYLFHFGFVWMVTAANFKSAARLRGDPQLSEQYFFLIACQTVMIGVLLFALQSTTFHYPLKGWWLISAVSWVTWDSVRRSEMDRRRFLTIRPTSGSDLTPETPSRPSELAS